jgi:hypothetical protein
LKPFTGVTVIAEEPCDVPEDGIETDTEAGLAANEKSSELVVHALKSSQ